MDRRPCGSASFAIPALSREEFSKPKQQDFRKPAIASQSRVFCLAGQCHNPASGGGNERVKSMSINPIRVPTVFGPETQFPVKAGPPATFRAWRESELERLKAQLLGERLEEAADLESNVHLRRAANDAVALAWSTAYPLLVLPVLFEEKATVALARLERQKEIRGRSKELLGI